MIKGVKNGFTLIEVVITIALFSLVSVLVASFIVFNYKSYQKTNEESLAVERLSSNLQNIVEELRTARNGVDGAYLISEANSHAITFYAKLEEGEDIAKISYFIYEGALYKSVTIPNNLTTPPSYSEENEKIVKVAEQITNDETLPLFRYFGKDPLNNGEYQELLEPLDNSKIKLIEISLRTLMAESEQERLIQSKILLRNVPL